MACVPMQQHEALPSCILESLTTWTQLETACMSLSATYTYTYTWLISATGLPLAGKHATAAHVCAPAELQFGIPGVACQLDLCYTLRHAYLEANHQGSRTSSRPPYLLIDSHSVPACPDIWHSPAVLLISPDILFMLNTVACAAGRWARQAGPRQPGQAPGRRWRTASACCSSPCCGPLPWPAMLPPRAPVPRSALDLRIPLQYRTWGAQGSELDRAGRGCCMGWGGRGQGRDGLRCKAQQSLGYICHNPACT